MSSVADGNWQLNPRKPARIVCLTEEPTEILYLLGEESRIVGISAYTCRPPRAKEEKPVVSAFVGGNVKKIVALEPDLIIGFSDVQAELARDLIAHNLQVLILNQRSLQDILDVVQLIGRIVGQERRAKDYVQAFIKHLQVIAQQAKKLTKRPKVYFEEWDEPMISGIQWVSELIAVAGGEDIFADRATGKRSKERYVSSEEVMARAPEIYIASWCGKTFVKETVLARAGWSGIPAIVHDRVYELDPSIILQPGPACLTDGLEALARIIQLSRS